MIDSNNRHGIARKAIILALAAFLYLSLPITGVKAETPYALENLINNGDFSVDTDGNGLANDWLQNVGSGYASIINGQQKVTASGTKQYNSLYGSTNSYFTLSTTHKYYLNIYNIVLSKSADVTFRIYLEKSTGGDAQLLYSSVNDISEFTSYFTGGFNGTYRFCIELTKAPTVAVDEYFIIDNVIFIDLTASFGMGFEPSLSDFETLYLPELDYFEYYNSFIPESVNSVYLSDYADIGEDLTTVNWQKSIFSEYGRNVTIDLYAYFFDPPYGSYYDPIYYDSDVMAQYCRDFYIYYNNPTMRYMDKDYTLSWVGDDTSGRVMRLELSADDEIILKRILFDRSVDFDEQYFKIRAERIYDPYGGGIEYPLDWQVRFYFVLSNTYNMCVNIEQILISSSIESDIDEYDSTDWALYGFNTMFFNWYNKYDELYLPSLMVVNDTRTAQSRLIDNFGLQYTNVKRLVFGWQMASPNDLGDADAQYVDYYLHEIGAFSQQQTITPIDIIPDEDISGIDDLFEPTVAEWWDIGAHLKNLGNEIVNLFWIKMNVRGLVESFDTIIDKAESIGEILPPSVWAVVAIVFGAIGVGIIILIVDKIGGD